MDSNHASFQALLALHRARAGLSQTTLALLAGCSRQYIVQLETGQRGHPSLRLTAAIANTLQLRGTERSQFFAAAGYPSGDRAPAVERRELLDLAGEAIRELRYPAAVHDSMWRLYAWNQSALQTFGISPAHLRPAESSLIEYIFDPAFRKRFREWDPWARYLLSQFKRDSRGVIRQESSRLAIEHLRTLPDFARLWRSVEPAADSAPAISLAYSDGARDLELRVIRMLFLDCPDLWMILFLPANDPTRAAFAQS